MKSKGFTLIELMIAVAIVGILAAIAYPSYQAHVIKSRRATAQGCLLELAQFMERYYTTNMSYAGATLPAGTQCQTDLQGHYTFGFSGTPNATSYTLQATAQGLQADRDANCTPLTINQAGAKTPTTNDCWKK
ncbi:type IV pilin protein [Thermochromatium tepidum]|jgi:prepilin-type N-terminal cleavage/methylation domain|uniref:Prepilin-type N-terminal cleavage/methylation domain-containing protein n=1 Tax=Thermochromatium tepidum ATCC 43061 TaxID=316276 RepID=A0A6I6DZ13_THETI|nr:type IV pilin protein [Thermochromatium tepidum]QGU32844.1 prepilin-type N-terminal cleavage/methylation domain-containing protein [Thermochromatium tepidum ATCC 43061]